MGIIIIMATRAADRAFRHPLLRRSFPVRGWLLPAFVLASMLPFAPAIGAEWTVTPRLTIREVYTDNVTLAPPGEEKSDFVTDVNPSILARGEGRRVNVNLVYSPQAIIRTRDNTSDINHRLQADAAAELIKERIFFDFRSTVAQTNLTNTGRQTVDNISSTGNRVDTFTYSLSPYVRQRLGPFADALLRYTYDEVINSGDAFDSRSQSVDISITSGAEFTRFNWSTEYNRTHIENRDGGNQADVEFEKVEGTLRYRFNRQFSVFASGGVEDNEFESLQKNDGPFWGAGATWTPTSRTTFESSYGERFFGEFLTVSMRHRARRSIWSVNFDEDVTTTREIQLERVLIPFLDPFGNPIPDPLSGEPTGISIDTPTLTDEVIVRQRFEASVALEGRRTTVSLGGFHEDREFQRSGDTETARGVNATVSRQLSSRTSLNVLGGWQATDFQDGVREDTRWFSAVDIRRRFGRSVDGRLEYRRDEQDSNDAVNDFVEDRKSVV